MTRYIGTCNDCGNRVSPGYVAVHGRTRDPFHTAIMSSGIECGGTVDIDEDADVPTSLRVAMAPGQDRLPLGGGTW